MMVMMCVMMVMVHDAALLLWPHEFNHDKQKMQLPALDDAQKLFNIQYRTPNHDALFAATLCS